MIAQREDKMREQATTSSTPSKGNALILIGALVLFAAVFGGFGAFKYVVGSASASWPSTDGRITSSRLNQTGSGTKAKFRPSVSYSYTVQGSGYTGNQIRAVSSYSSRSRAEAELARYRVGSTVPVYYDPAKPASSLLVPGVTRSVYLMLATGIACLALAIVVLISSLRR
jgi:hypothetical protein